MTDQPWNANAGKYDRPSSGLPDGVTVEVRGDGPLAEAMRTCAAIKGQPIEEIEGELEGAAADGSLPTKLSPAIFRGLVSEAERLIDLRRDIALQMKAVRDAAKDRGVNVKAFNELLRRREMDARVRDDFDHSLAIYETVAGLSKGVIDRGELVARPALAAPQAMSAASKTKAELGAWLSGGLG